MRKITAFKFIDEGKELFKIKRASGVDNKTVDNKDKSTSSKKRIAMKRIMGVEKKNRIIVKVSIEKELLNALNQHKYHISDLINVLIEKELNDKGRL